MIGDNIRRFRKQKEWSQEQLARKMGYKSKSTINKIERNINDVNQKTISKFAKVFNCDPTDLMIDPSVAPLTMEVSDFEEQIVYAFRNASSDTQAAVCAVLGVKGDISLQKAKYIKSSKEA